MNTTSGVSLRLLPMTVTCVDEVVRVEQGAYAFPWTRGNFIDSLAGGHWTRVMRDASGAVVAYIVAMPGVEEMHLLNVTVVLAWRRRGLASQLLDALQTEALRRGAQHLWLEVRASNADAQALYAQRGFTVQGTRKGYYPAARGTREDAIVMSHGLSSNTMRHAT